MFSNQFLGSHDHCVIVFDMWPMTEEIAVTEETILPFDPSEIEGEVIGGRFIANQLSFQDNEGNELEHLTIVSSETKWNEVLAQELEEILA